MPTPLRHCRSSTGFRCSRSIPRGARCRKESAAIRCDLSAIAKGYAVDRVALGLTALGLADFMVEIGGEVRAMRDGMRPGRLWRIGIERPEIEGTAVCGPRWR